MLTPTFTLTQPTDCNSVFFTETTGNGEGGYSNGGNISYSNVSNTVLVIKFPDGTTKDVHKGYLPTSATNPNGTETYLPIDLGYTGVPSGVWDVTFKVFSTDVPSGNLIEGTEYIVTGANASITYEGIIYNENDRFVATSTLTYQESTPSQVNKLEGEDNCNFFIICGVKECLQKLMLQRCDTGCDCARDFHEAMNELIIDFNAAQLAFTNNNYACANKTIQRLEKQCGGICNECGC